MENGIRRVRSKFRAKSPICDWSNYLFKALDRQPRPNSASKSCWAAAEISIWAKDEANHGYLFSEALLSAVVQIKIFRESPFLRPEETVTFYSTWSNRDQSGQGGIEGRAIALLQIQTRIIEVSTSPSWKAIRTP
jgi:hypothetical protein